MHAGAKNITCGKPLCMVQRCLYSAQVSSFHRLLAKKILNQNNFKIVSGLLIHFVLNHCMSHRSAEKLKYTTDTHMKAN